jgi:FtsZ-binding cell division protein ZapB
MSDGNDLDFLAALEERVRQAAEQIRALRQENRELRDQVRALEDQGDAQGDWVRERAQVRDRVERLTERLEHLLSESGPAE